MLSRFNHCSAVANNRHYTEVAPYFLDTLSCIIIVAGISIIENLISPSPPTLFYLVEIFSYMVLFNCIFSPSNSDFAFSDSLDDILIGTRTSPHKYSSLW